MKHQHISFVLYSIGETTKWFSRIVKETDVSVNNLLVKKCFVVVCRLSGSNALFSLYFCVIIRVSHVILT